MRDFYDVYNKYVVNTGKESDLETAETKLMTERERHVREMAAVREVCWIFLIRMQTARNLEII